MLVSTLKQDFVSLASILFRLIRLPQLSALSADHEKQENKFQSPWTQTVTADVGFINSGVDTCVSLILPPVTCYHRMTWWIWVSEPQRPSCNLLPSNSQWELWDDAQLIRHDPVKWRLMMKARYRRGRLRKTKGQCRDLWPNVERN